MLDRIVKTSCLPMGRLAGLLVLFAAGSVLAQTPAPTPPAQFDPSDVYFQGYLAIRAAEKLEASEDYAGAAEKFQSARKMLDTIKRYYPDWKPEMVAGRSSKNAEAIEKIRTKADEQRRKSRSVVAELEGGTKRSGTPADPADPSLSPTPGILEVDPIASRKLSEAEAEVNRLRALQSSSEDPSRDASRVRDLTRQRDAIQAQLRAAEANVQSLRARLATRPMEHEMKSLAQRISGLEQEREAMNLALTQSRSSHTEALARNAILEADLKVMQQKYANLDRDLKAERNVANSVVAGQRTQLQALEKDLANKSRELDKANEKISGLMNELQETHDAFAQLRTERDSLLLEKDQLSAMLKLNQDGRIQDLVQQNIGLAKSLREANEKVDRLNLDNNATKDDITSAMRDLAIAKARINKLQLEKREQDTRIEEMESRLKGEEAALVDGKTSTDPAEVAMLRDIIQRQLRVQDRRRQARDLLVEAVKDMGAKDERVGEAMQLFEGEEVQLTPDEQRLLADKNVDGEFVSPFAKDRTTVNRNTDELNHDIAVFERTAEKSFAAGRLLPTRELFQMIVEKHPGHVPSICKLGVVQLRLKDPVAAADLFRRAVELDAENPYAHRMLGFAQMSQGRLTDAVRNIRKAVQLAPEDAKNQLLLGIIENRLGHTREAESCYKAAIFADPTPSEPYYNLALLYSKDKRLDAARDFYHQALEHGAIPDPKLEQRLATP